MMTMKQTRRGLVMMPYLVEVISDLLTGIAGAF